MKCCEFQIQNVVDRVAEEAWRRSKILSEPAAATNIELQAWSHVRHLNSRQTQGQYLCLPLHETIHRRITESKMFVYLCALRTFFDRWRGTNLP